MLMLIFSVNVTWYRKSCKYFNDLKNVDSKYDDYYDVSVGSILSDGERQIARWKGVVNRFKGKLGEVIKDVDGRFDDYSRQFLLH